MDITVNSFFKIWNERDDLIGFVDVRTFEENRDYRVDNFDHIPVDQLESRLNEIMHYKKLYFLCRSGVRSGFACDIMKRNNYSGAVFNIQGGILEWNNNDFPILRGWTT